MRYIFILLLFTSCTKDWNCTATTESQAGTITSEIDFRGTTEEKNDFEDQGTQTTQQYDFGTGDYYTVSQTTECY